MYQYEVTKTVAKLSYEKLAEVAQQRGIHTWFEQAWSRGMNGVNPVLSAIKAVNTEKDKNDRDFNLKVSGAIGFVCILSVFTIALFCLHPDLRYNYNNLPVAGNVAVAVLIVVTGALLAAEAIFTFLFFKSELDKKIPSPLNYIAAASNFCADLQVFITGMDIDVDAWFNWSFCADEKAHKFMAFTILVRMAKQILLVQASISADEQEKKYDAMENARVIHKGKLTKELDEKYNALQRIGMVSGGYKKIYEKAAELIKEAEAQS